MKKHGIIKILLVFIILIWFAFIAMHALDADSLANEKSDSRKLEQLFDDMGVLKLSLSHDPIDIRLKDLNGQHVSLSDFRGKIVFLNFWTTWCPTCRIEMPSMEKLHQKLKNKDFAMVTINIQESVSQVKKFFKEFKLTFTALLDTTGEVATGFNIRAIPTTFIMDKNGKIIGSIMGPREWDSKKSVALFEHLADKYTATSTLVSTH